MNDIEFEQREREAARVAICSRMDTIEYRLACGDMMANEADDLRIELECLEDHLEYIRTVELEK